MFTLQKRFTFEAAHQLPHHDGKCRRLHGHSWVGWVEVKGEHLEASGPKSGMVMDFADLSAAIRPLVEDRLDHYFLNESLMLESPTSEAIAKWLFDELRLRGVPVTSVAIEETCTSRCVYQESQ